jgi:hypothetical protein
VIRERLVRTYDFCLLHEDGRVIGVASKAFGDEDQARAEAARLARRHPVVEVWTRVRRVARLTNGEA